MLNVIIYIVMYIAIKLYKNHTALKIGTYMTQFFVLTNIVHCSVCTFKQNKLIEKLIS